MPQRSDSNYNRGKNGRKNRKSNNQLVAAVEAQQHLQSQWRGVATPSGDSVCAMQSGEGVYKKWWRCSQHHNAAA